MNRTPEQIVNRVNEIKENDWMGTQTSADSVPPLLG